MSALFPPRGAPAPPSPDGLRIGAVLAVLVHVLLLIALFMIAREAGRSGA